MNNENKTDQIRAAGAASELTDGLGAWGHHIWCNYASPNRPANECDMCNRFNKLYPMDGLTPDEHLEKFFPDVIKRT